MLLCGNSNDKTLRCLVTLGMFGSSCVRCVTSQKCARHLLVNKLHVCLDTCIQLVDNVKRINITSVSWTRSECMDVVAQFRHSGSSGIIYKTIKSLHSFSNEKKDRRNHKFVVVNGAKATFS